MTQVIQERPIRILLVEDNPGDVYLLKESLETSKFPIRVDSVPDGEMALAYLRQENKSRPDLILLDLNLPVMDGRETLMKIKADSKLKSIPVVILSTSDSDEDIKLAYSLQANHYITKPVGLDQFYKVVEALEDFWSDLVKLPSIAQGKNDR